MALPENDIVDCNENAQKFQTMRERERESERSNKSDESA